jgi:hypothetical protein
VTCSEMQELIGADPEGISDELRSHLQNCPGCREYHGQMLELNAKLRRALEFDVRLAARPPLSDAPLPPSGSNVIRLAERRPGARGQKRRGLGIGLGLAAGLLLALTLWVSRPQPALAAELVRHVEGEPDSWSRTRPLDSGEVAAVLRKSGVQLQAMPEPVVYASSCFFRGHFVPHFVVMTHSGPVTVMILTHQPVKAREEFHADGYSGLLVPVQGGSVAVLSKGSLPLDKPAAEMAQALTPD